MAHDRKPLTPSERFHALLDGISEERLAAIDRKVKDPSYGPPEPQLLDDPDPFGRDWDWLPSSVTKETESRSS